MSESALELALLADLEAAGLAAGLEREYRFCEGRKWAFDFAYPLRRLGIEIEGGTWRGGRHVRPLGFARDCEKYNAATLAGWRVLRFTTEQVSSGQALEVIGAALGATVAT